MQTKNFTLQEPIELCSIIEANEIDDNERLLIQLFVSNPTQEYLDTLHQELQDTFKKAHIIGASSDGAIANAKLISSPYTLISFTQFETTNLLSYGSKHLESDYQSGLHIGDYFQALNPKVLIIFADAFNSNAEELLKGIYQKLPNIIIAGGLASRDENFDKTYVFNQSYLSHSGVVAVGLCSESLYTIDSFAFDWVPIGTPKKITKALYNRVYEIDNMSAVAFYDKYLGDKVAQNLPTTGIEFPLIIKRQEDYIGRAVLQSHEDGSITFAGNIHIGEQVQFGIGDIESIIKHSQNYSEVLNYSNIESIFIYSCTARKHFLDSDIAIELDALEHIAPTSGFFTFGEFYNQNLLNQSNRYIALSEKPLEKTQHIVNRSRQVNSNKITILKALLNLTNATSRDLDRLNSSLETKVLKQQQDIARNIYYDDNTNLPNRIKLLQDILHYKNKHIVLFNIDRFSRINYFYGFDAGDMLIRELSNYLKSQFKNIGILYKLPSDEFALILTDHRIDMRPLINFISQELKMMLFNYQEIKVPYTVTMGIAKIVGDGISMRHADISVNHARLVHKPYAFYEDIERETKKTIKNTTTLALTTREAIKNDCLCMHYQPIYDLKSGKIHSYEALARLCIDEQKLMPNEFLPILPYIHLSNEFVKLVIDQTFKLVAKEQIRVSLNLAIDNILDADINDYLCTQLQKYNLYDKLTIEILETEEIVESDEITEFIERAKSLGIQIAIDDFGSGFANFEYITKINANILKIDGSLIKNIDSDHNAKIVVETIVSFAKKLGMKTVAEYVHSKEIYALVKTLDIDYAQGYFLAQPSPIIIKEQ
jgi:diguanylate cyclase (GGDEF)-like protein